MEISYIKVIESLVVIVIFILIRTASNIIIDKTKTSRLIQKSRAKIIKKGVNLILMVLLITMIFIIWGVNQSALAFYIGSILTIVGVAFFAQWSILSNITSSIILFFNHPVKLEDTIIIMEAKEYEIEGRVSNIGLFFVTLKTTENEEITLPNNVFLQKLIKKKVKA